MDPQREELERLRLKELESRAATSSGMSSALQDTRDRSLMSYGDSSYLRNALDMVQYGGGVRGGINDLAMAMEDPNKTPLEQRVARDNFARASAIYDKENRGPLAKKMAAKALETGLGIAGNEIPGVGLVAGPVLQEAGSYLGETLGLREPKTNEDRIKDLVQNGIIGAAAKALPAIGNFARSRISPTTYARTVREGEALSQPYALSGSLGHRADTRPDRYLAGKIEDAQGTLGEVNPFGGVPYNQVASPATGQLDQISVGIANMRQAQQGAMASRAGVLSSIDSKLGKPAIVVDGGTIRAVNSSLGNRFDDDAIAFAQKKIDEINLKQVSTGPSYSGFSSSKAVREPLTAAQLQDQIEKIDDELALIGKFDPSKAAAGVDPRVDAILRIKGGAEGLELARTTLQQKLLQEADGVDASLRPLYEKANKTYGDLKQLIPEYEGFAKQTVAMATAPEASPRSIPGAIADSGKGFWGNVKDVAKLPFRPSPVARNAELIRKTQVINSLRSNPGAAPFQSIPSWALGTLQSMTDSPLLPRNTKAIEQMPPRELGQKVFMGLSRVIPPELAAQEAMNISQMVQDHAFPDEGKRMEIEGLSKRYPFIFEKNQDGYLSVMDGKMSDPVEISTHLMKGLDAYQDDVSSRAEFVGGLLGNRKYIPIKDQTVPVAPLPEVPNLSLSDLDSAFAIEAKPDPQGIYGVENSTFDTLNMVSKMRDAESLRSTNY